MSKTLLELKRSLINMKRDIKKTSNLEEKLNEISKYLELRCSDIFNFDNEEAITIINSGKDTEETLKLLDEWMEECERSIFKQSEDIVNRLSLTEHMSKPGITDDLDRLVMQILQGGKASYKYENLESLKASYSQIRKKQPVKIALMRYALSKLV